MPPLVAGSGISPPSLAPPPRVAKGGGFFLSHFLPSAPRHWGLRASEKAGTKRGRAIYPPFEVGARPALSYAGTPDAGQTNEALCKVLCHNVCVLIQETHELGIEPAI